MISAAFAGGADGVVRHLRQFSIPDERQVLRPGDVEENLQAMLKRQIEKPLRRRVIDARAVAAQLRDLLEILLGLLWRRKRIAIRVRFERAVRNALHVK